MRKNPTALPRARSYLAGHRRFTISLVTRFEILRGLKAKRATAQLAAFEAFCGDNEVLPITDGVIVRAADIYADLHGRGQLIPDAEVPR
jgi:tRNA(fMet)-specific endonuclease VapC